MEAVAENNMSRYMRHLTHNLTHTAKCAERFKE